jgi:hypothetical protein
MAREFPHAPSGAVTDGAEKVRQFGRSDDVKAADIPEHLEEKDD